MSTVIEIDTAALREFTDRYFAAWEAHDIDAIALMHAPDGLYWSHGAGEAVEGRDNIKSAFADLFAALPGFGFRMNRLLFGDRFYVLDWVLTAQLGDRAVEWDCLDVVTLNPDGLIASKDVYYDHPQMHAAIGG
jgi:ketosteroid isomerase-like protein